MMHLYRVLKATTLSLLSILFLQSAQAQQTHTQLSLDQLLDSVQTLVEEEGHVGLMLGIVSGDSVWFQGGFGFADRETQRQVDGNTLFRMGSITKMLVSLGILNLVNEKKLNWGNKLKDIAPEIPFQNPWEETHPVRLIHLLEHTTGFDDVKLNRMYSLDPQTFSGLESVLHQKNSLVCRWKPGERVAYSNPGYAVLGYLLEKMGGKPFDQYLQENILLPLGMNQTHIHPGPLFPERETREYIHEGGEIHEVPAVWVHNGPAGALWSSANDMTKLIQFLIRTSDQRMDVKDQKMYEKSHTSLAAKAGLRQGYAMGNDATLLHAKSPFRGHEGLTGTCFSGIHYSQKHQVGFVVSSNSNQQNDRIEALIASFLLQDVKEEPQKNIPIDPEVIKPFLGAYQFKSPRNEISGFSEKLQNLPRIFMDDNRLYIKPLTGSPSELIQTDSLVFSWPDMNRPLFVFTHNEEGKRVMCMGGAYFEQTSYTWAMAKRIGWGMVGLLSVIGLLGGFWGIIGRIRGKLKGAEWLPSMLPMLGLGSLVLAFMKAREVQKYTYKLSEMGSVNIRTLIIFLGTLFFGIASVTYLGWAVWKYRKTENRWVAGFRILIGISLLMIVLLLGQNGWIGLRTWAM